MNHISICTCEHSKCIRTNDLEDSQMISRDLYFPIRKKNMLQFDVFIVFNRIKKMNPLNGFNLDPHICCMHNLDCNFMRQFLIDSPNGKSSAELPVITVRITHFDFLSILLRYNCVWNCVARREFLVYNCHDTSIKPSANESVLYVVHHTMYPS